MSVRVKINYGRPFDEILNDPALLGELMPRAQRALAAAKADPHDETFAYENSLRIDVTNTDRLVVRVVAGDYKGHILEAKYGILARALDAAGGA